MRTRLFYWPGERALLAANKVLLDRIDRAEAVIAVQQRDNHLLRNALTMARGDGWKKPDPSMFTIPEGSIWKFDERRTDGNGRIRDIEATAVLAPPVDIQALQEARFVACRGLAWKLMACTIVNQRAYNFGHRDFEVGVAQIEVSLMAFADPDWRGSDA